MRTQPLFTELAYLANVVVHPESVPAGWLRITSHGGFVINPEHPGTPDEWAWVFACALLHLGLGHLPVRWPHDRWVLAADIAAQSFLRGIKVGRRPSTLPPLPDLPVRDVERLFHKLRDEGVPVGVIPLGLAGPNDLDLEPGDAPPPERWQSAFAAGVDEALRRSLEVAGTAALPAQRTAKDLRVLEAMRWFVGGFPLLGALASTFEVTTDPRELTALQIKIAAVDPGGQRIYVNPAGLSDEELRFVLAHEMLHAGLRHDERRQGRDPFLWNCACDYVINGWLVEMAVGAIPRVGVLYDPKLSGRSAEEIYDGLVEDLRQAKKLRSLRGKGVGDIVSAADRQWWEGCSTEIDALYRRALRTGLALHRELGRGSLPAGLIEVIRALAHPPLPWDVELAQWFDLHFQPVELHRTYARPSRRQSSTPEIPRPRTVRPYEEPDARTFGVVLDTSGSMPRYLLGKALGAIASTAASRDVAAARIVFCDAVAYDEGYLPVEEIARRVRVRGRGGTRLQPGIDLLEGAPDFPSDGPILVITDGACDVLRVRREHAFLMPRGCRLPFKARGPVFYVR